MNTLDVVLVNIISYMSGIITGFILCFKYKKHLLLKTSSHDQLSDILSSIHTEIANTNPGPPIFTGTPIMESEPPIIASAPSKEIVIRT